MVVLIVLLVGFFCVSDCDCSLGCWFDVFSGLRWVL